MSERVNHRDENEAEELMKNGKLTLGLIASSNKENEKRVAIHPAHFRHFDDETRPYVYAEKGYGKNFRIRDEDFAPHVAGLLDREALFERCDALMIFKPTEQDFPFFREGQVLWGAVHTVQNPAIVDVAIEKRMTLIAMEDMHIWRSDGRKGVWLFHTQSELAGYCSVLQALQLTGTKGWYDQPRRAAVISFGSTGRGAVHALRALDYTDITVFTMRSPLEVLATIPMVKYGQYVPDPDHRGMTRFRAPDGSEKPFAQALSDYDVIVNCVLQDTDNPLMFVTNDDLPTFKPGSLVVDVSCDRGMGFEFARPTSFDEPLVEFGQGVVYYGVDHSPSYFYNTASLEHSKEAWPWLKHVVGGREAWARCPTVGKAIEIDEGHVEFKKILTYQNREESYPHRVRK